MLVLDGVLVTGLAWKPSHRMGLQGGGTELQLKLGGGGLPPALRAGPGVTLLMQLCMEPSSIWAPHSIHHSSHALCPPALRRVTLVSSPGGCLPGLRCFLHSLMGRALSSAPSPAFWGLAGKKVFPSPPPAHLISAACPALPMESSVTLQPC